MLLFTDAGLIGAVVITLIIGLSGWVSGWLNENQGNGSIIPSWLVHGSANLISSLVVMF
jgi:hypothetical protein